jgi:hypothetical protein
MDDNTYVGLDGHKATVCVAVPESGRGGQVRQVGVFQNRPEILCKMAAKLGRGGRRLSFCYACPKGYGPRVPPASAELDASGGVATRTDRRQREAPDAECSQSRVREWIKIAR